ncbi:putative endosomal cargo receptor [Talaromyces proteolyticus]|uniref:Endosomal cargo receptor n=1 Tax=Talaromyces proteolyticus TaxID=1131652 RepID=A0AAD4KU86_9EURO|nr:putative endosomal cargo receptor [Talaromyces proteolyticus]KAH8697180.1 putative endosomal cargo receptor [Talaromyces proteolyticus]
MSASRISSSWPLFAFMLLTVLSSQARALHLYMEGRQEKCFFEELPKDTLVVGTYNADILDTNTNTWVKDPSLQVVITVVETFDNDHRVVNQRTKSDGRFTFTAADAGQHKICFTPDSQNGGWLSSNPTVKLGLDIAIGATSKIETEDSGKMADIVQRVKDLNSRLEDIRREQVFQREREAEFRDQSEATNSRVVRWTLMQLAVLSVTCAWQLSHLRSFFIKQKLT